MMTELEEAIDYGLSDAWGILQDGRALRVVTIGSKPVRLILADGEHRAQVAHALDIALTGDLAADAVSELSSWRTVANVSVRRIEDMGLEVRFMGVDEDVEIAVDSIIYCVLSEVGR